MSRPIRACKYTGTYEHNTIEDVINFSLPEDEDSDSERAAGGSVSKSSSINFRGTTALRIWIQKNFTKEKKPLYLRYCHEPTRNFEGEAFHGRQYFHSLRVGDELYQRLQASYDNLINTYFDYAQNTRGFRTRDECAQFPLVESLNNAIWKLFIGFDKNDEELTYKDFDTVMAEFYQMERDRLAELQRKRKTWKLEFLDGSPWKWVTVNGVEWLVTKKSDLPWLIPTNYHWHNSKAVTPTTFEYFAEIIQCGRLVFTNKRLYECSPFYPNILHNIIFLSEHVLPRKLDESSNYFMEWIHEKWAFFQPSWQLVVAPVGSLGYALFLSFDKRSVDEYPNHIFVPRAAIIDSLTGEIRPFDIFVSQSHEVQYINENKRTKGEPTIDGQLICTAYNGTPLRPGIGTAGFMANCTCQDPNFGFYEMKLGHNENHLIAGSSFMYKYLFLQAQKDITGQDIRSMQQKLSYPGGEMIMQGLYQNHRDRYFFPVEFQYNNEVSKDKAGSESASKDAASSEPASKEPLVKNCICMTHCMWKKPQHRSYLHMGHKATTQRVVNRVPPLQIGDINEHYRDVQHQPNTSGYVKYVSSVTWLRQFQDIASSDLLEHLMPMKNVPKDKWPQPKKTDADDLTKLLDDIARYEGEIESSRVEADFSNSSPDASPDKRMHPRKRRLQSQGDGSG